MVIRMMPPFLLGGSIPIFPIISMEVHPLPLGKKGVWKRFAGLWIRKSKEKKEGQSRLKETGAFIKAEL